MESSPYESIHKAFKSVFESLKKKYERIIMQAVLNNIKTIQRNRKTLSRMLQGEQKLSKGSIPKRIVVNGQEIMYQ